MRDLSPLAALTYLLDIVFIGTLSLIPEDSGESMREIEQVSVAHNGSVNETALLLTSIVLFVIVSMHIANIAAHQSHGRWLAHGLIALALPTIWAWKFLF